MDVKELKFLLKLLGYKNYQVSIQKIQLEPGMKVSERDEICYRLSDLGFVKFTGEVTKFNIAPKGKSLLDSKKAASSLTSEELKVLKASANGVISPRETGIAATYRQAVIQDLLDGGLIKTMDQKIKEVWLTEPGKQFLCQEYSSRSSAKEISLKMLSDYLQLMRTYKFPHSPRQKGAAESGNDGDTGGLVGTGGDADGNEHLPLAHQPLAHQRLRQEKRQFFKVSNNKPTDSEILAVIQDLDGNLGTDNYLPIFHLREKLQPPLSRAELDQALYRLERNDQIELSSLQEVRAYTPEQVEAGIPQDIGGRLFFIIPY